MPYASLLQGLPLQGFICLPVARPPALENLWSGLVCVLYPNCVFASASAVVWWSGLVCVLYSTPTGLVWSVFYTLTMSFRQLRMVRDPERNLAPWSGGLVWSVFYTQPYLSVCGR